MIEETKLEGETENAVLGQLTAEQELFKSKRIIDKEDAYHQGRLRRGRLLSPERQDFFSKDAAKPESSMQEPAVG